VWFYEPRPVVNENKDVRYNLKLKTKYTRENEILLVNVLQGYGIC